MDRFASMKAFVAVVEAGGFAPAARHMGLATSSVTRQVDALEARLSARLLNRSTRKVTLTDAGQGYYEKAVRLLGDLEEADLAVAGGERPHGVLRVSAPLAFGRLHLTPVLGAYLEACPEVRLDLLFTDALTDLVALNIDVAIRLGGLEDGGLIARRLADHRRLVCASPAYLQQQGRPERPGDLADHSCLTFAYGPGRDVWRFQADAGPEAVEVAARVRANSSETLVQLALSGLGFVMMPTWLVGAEVAAGRLVPVLTGWQANPGAMDTGIHAVYLENRRGVPKVRSFIDFLLAEWQPQPPWERGLEI
ncbi:LysR family transcriptional regulator [Pelagibius sp.]|uniref:LysR family transcriptional regulator n=1 Tax=Pelagibius sp. TaxID=1931238 RepID=UPI0026311451|nr:LysR family transcriptional regulator [Pelagibius sp.]